MTRKSQTERVRAHTMDGGTPLPFLVRIKVKVTKRKSESNGITCDELSTRESEAHDTGECVRARNSRLSARRSCTGDVAFAT